MTPKILTPAGAVARRANIESVCGVCGGVLTTTFGGGGVCLKPDCGGYTVEKEIDNG